MLTTENKKNSVNMLFIFSLFLFKVTEVKEVGWSKSNSPLFKIKAIKIIDILS